MSQSEDVDLEADDIDADSTVVVTDSENYGQTQRLKHIYKLRSKVQDLKMQQHELSKEYDDYWANKRGWEIFSEELASTVALYGAELLPVFNQVDDIAEDDYILSWTENIEVDIRQFITKDGQRLKDGDIEPYKPLYSLGVYQRLNELLERCGLGINIGESKGPAQI